MGPSITAQPIGPRLTTSVAGVTRRTALSAAMMSVSPPAMANSSSVPITRSKSGRIASRCFVTVSLATKRVSPSPRLVSPHSTGL